MRRLFLCFFFGTLLIHQLNCSGAKHEEVTPETLTEQTTDGSSIIPDGQPDQTLADNLLPESTAETKTESTPEVVADLTPVASDLTINEINAKGEPNDWCEISNRGSQVIDLSEYTISDEPTNPQKRTKFPAGTTIKAGEYKIFEMTDAWPGFKLGSEEELAIFNPKGELIALVKWKDGDSPTGKSFGRIPDATGPFKTLDTPTPAATNKDNGSTPPPQGKLVLNEIFASGTPDWFEIYNAGDGELDLTNYTATDTPTDPATRLAFPTAKKIPPKTYMVFQLDGNDFAFKFGSSEALAIYDPQGNEVAKVEWKELPSGKSYSRSPNGDPSGTWKTTDPSQGQANP